MLASHRFLACCFFLQSAFLSVASPLLSERGNSRHLKCTNAPNVVAGYYLDPKDAQPPTSERATCQAEYKYLYCVPDTKPYLFFGTLESSLRSPTLYATALFSSVAFINKHIATQNDTVIERGLTYLQTPGTGVQIYAEDTNNHHLTWGVFGAALQGLNAWMADEGNGYSDATFQINDGSNQVGNGYIGALNAKGICVFANALIPNTTCVASDVNEEVYGPKGGKLC